MTEDRNSTANDEATRTNALLQVAERFVCKGRFLEAEQALENLLSKYSPEDKEQIKPLMQLAEVKRELGHFWECEQLTKRALSLKQKYQEYKEFDSLLLLLANVFLDQGRMEEAEKLFNESKSLSETLHGSEHPRVAQHLVDLAELKRLKGDFGKAESLLLNARNMLESKPSEMNSVTYVESLNNLGLLYHETKEHENAEKNFRRALNVLHSGMSSGKLEATVRNNLGRLLREKEKPDLVSAESFIRSGLVLSEQLGAFHPDVAVSLSDLADLCLSMRRFDEAKVLLERALEIRERIFGTESKRLIHLLQNLGEACLELKDYEPARDYFLRALALKTMELGKEDAGVKTISERLQVIFEKLGDRTQSELYGAKAKELRNS